MSNKNSLEQKILDSVYKFEAKRTAFFILKTMVFLGLSFVGLYLSLNLLAAVLYEEQTLAVLQIVYEEPDVIWQYLFDILETLYIETPLDIFLAVLIFVLLTIILVVWILKNFIRIKNKVIAIMRYFK